MKGRRLCTNTPTRLGSLYNQFLVNVPERKRQENVNCFFQLVVNKGPSYMRHGEKTFSTDRDSERKIIYGEGKNGCKKRAMGKMGGAKRLKFKGQREIQDSIS